MKTLIIIFLFTTCNIILTAQTTNTWSFVGPINNPTILGGTSSSTNGSGRICDIAFHPTNSNLLYLSSPRGSVYLRNESTNSSNLINPDFPYSFTRSGVATIAIDPKDANNILIGTGDSVSTPKNRTV